VRNGIGLLGDQVPRPISRLIHTLRFFTFLYISHIIQLTPQQQSAESRNSAGAEALAVARSPKEASREKFSYISHIIQLSPYKPSAYFCILRPTQQQRRAPDEGERDRLAGGPGTQSHFEVIHTLRYTFLVSHIIQLTPQQQSAESRNSAGAEALAVARRPKEASRETFSYHSHHNS